MRYIDLLESTVDDLTSEIIDMLSALSAEGITEINTKGLLRDLTNEYNAIDEQELVELLNSLDMVASADEDIVTLGSPEDEEMDPEMMMGPGSEDEMMDPEMGPEPGMEPQGGPMPPGGGPIPPDEDMGQQSSSIDDEDIDYRIDSLRPAASRIDTLARKKAWSDL